MKCGIITFHRAINYGGILQAFALQKALKKIGAESEIIDYRCAAIERQYRPKLKDKLSVAYIKRVLYAILKNGIIKFNTSGFEGFAKKYMNVSSRPFYSGNDLKNAEYDCFITGSDQVWSYYCAGFDKAYFLDFVADGNKKNSYAASFGVGSIPDELKPEYKRLLDNFKNLSVREESGADIVNDLLNFRPELVPDPTLLLSKEEWEKILPPKRVMEGKYILVYMLEPNPDLLDRAQEMGRQKNMKVVYINNAIYKKKGVINLKHMSPDQWVDLFYNAEYVFTNSFHGTAFSINFNKNFYVAALKGNSKVNSRITNILDRYGLENTSASGTLAENAEKLDLNKKIETDRNCGYSYLRRIIGD